jgi:hypothetical protein
MPLWLSISAFSASISGRIARHDFAHRRPEGQAFVHREIGLGASAFPVGLRNGVHAALVGNADQESKRKQICGAAVGAAAGNLADQASALLRLHVVKEFLGGREGPLACQHIDRLAQIRDVHRMGMEFLRVEYIGSGLAAHKAAYVHAGGGIEEEAAKVENAFKAAAAIFAHVDDQGVGASQVSHRLVRRLAEGASGIREILQLDVADIALETVNAAETGIGKRRRGRGGGTGRRSWRWRR